MSVTPADVDVRTSRTMKRRVMAGLAAVGLAVMGLVGSSLPASAAVDPVYGNFDGSLVVSATSVAVGQPIVVTENAINLSAAQTSFITVGIYRVGFTVSKVTKPRTGICRIAGSATCSSLSLAPNETQSYTLTLVPTAAGTFTIKGWTTQPITGRGFGTSVVVTVH